MTLKRVIVKRIFKDEIEGDLEIQLIAEPTADESIEDCVVGLEYKIDSAKAKLDFEVLNAQGGDDDESEEEHTDGL